MGHLAQLGPKANPDLRYHAPNECPIDLHVKMANYHNFFKILTTIQYLSVMYQNKGNLIGFS